METLPLRVNTGIVSHLFVTRGSFFLSGKPRTQARQNRWDVSNALRPGYYKLRRKTRRARRNRSWRVAAARRDRLGPLPEVDDRIGIHFNRAFFLVMLSFRLISSRDRNFLANASSKGAFSLCKRSGLQHFWIFRRYHFLSYCLFDYLVKSVSF